MANPLGREGAGAVVAGGRAEIIEVPPELLRLMALRDAALGDSIRTKLPPETYTSVTVETVEDFRFPGGDPKPARIISLDVKTYVAVGRFFYAVFAGLGLLNDEALRGDLDPDKLGDQLLKRITDAPGAVDEITRAYQRCTNVVLCISSDGRNMKIQIKENDVVLGAYHVARVARELVPHLIGWAMRAA